MIEIPDSHRFEPDGNALEMWLYTRKAKKEWGNNKFPGFFSTFNFPTDQVFFTIALILEIIGIGLIISNGLSENSGPQLAIIAIIVAIALVFFDFGLAYLLHKNHATKCYGLNKLAVSSNPSEIANINEDLKKGKIINVVCIFLLVFLAIFKVGGIVALSTFDHIVIYVALVMMFSIIVYIHIYHTGYFIYGVITKRAFKRQLNKLNRGDDSYKAKASSYFFESDINIFDGFDDQSEIIANDRHKITKIERKRESSKKNFGYELRSIGILEDRDITSFINKPFNSEQKGLIMSECRKFQLDQYENKI